jgi:cytidylate kinase
VSHRPRGLVVAIDGPSGAGKSTAGRALAERLGYVFLDTGAMYRALALRALRDGVSLDDAEALAGLARAIHIELEQEGRVRLDD